MTASTFRTLLLTGSALTTHAANAQLPEWALVTGLFSKIDIHSVSVGVSGIRTLGDDGMKRSNALGVSTEVFLGLPPTKWVNNELSLGTHYVQGVELQDPRVELRGGLLTFPSLSLYSSWTARCLEPYVGLSIGVTDLWNAQVYDRRTPVGVDIPKRSVSGRSFEAGLVLGVARQIPRSRFEVFVEAQVRHRQFPALTYSGDGAVPDFWPRTLNASTGAISAGLQFALKADSPSPTLWSLVAVDGDSLAAEVSVERTREAQIVTTEVTEGTLTLDPKPECTGTRFVFRRRERVTTRSAGEVIKTDYTSPADIVLCGVAKKEGDLPTSLRSEIEGADYAFVQRSGSRDLRLVNTSNGRVWALRRLD